MIDSLCNVSLLSVVIFFALQSIFLYIIIATRASFKSIISQYIFFHPFTFNLPIILNSKSVSYKRHIVESYCFNLLCQFLPFDFNCLQTAVCCMQIFAVECLMSPYEAATEFSGNAKATSC